MSGSVGYSLPGLVLLTVMFDSVLMKLTASSRLEALSRESPALVQEPPKGVRVMD